MPELTIDDSHVSTAATNPAVDACPELALIAEEMSLRDLRKAMNRTQVQLAKTLNVGQDTVSRYERRSDMLLSTLQDYVQAMGGELELVVTFPDRKPVKLKSLAEVAS